MTITNLRKQIATLNALIAFSSAMWFFGKSYIHLTQPNANFHLTNEINIAYPLIPTSLFLITILSTEKENFHNSEYRKMFFYVIFGLLPAIHISFLYYSFRPIELFMLIVDTNYLPIFSILTMLTIIFHLLFFLHSIRVSWHITNKNTLES